MHVLAVVHLHDTQTGQKVVYHDKTAYASTDAAYAQWAEGECSCDCNRGLAIWKATHAGQAMPVSMVRPCRRGKRAIIQVEKIELLVVIDEGSVAHATTG